MKTYNLNETEGFNFGVTVLSNLQEAYLTYSQLSKIAGNKAIVSGCEDLGTTVGDGFVVIDGEFLEFKGSIKQTTVVIKQEDTQREYENGVMRPFETYRYVTFGSAPNAISWDSFKRVPPLNEIPAQLNALNTKIDGFINAMGFLRKGEIFIGDVNGKAIGWEYIGSDYKVKLINNTGGGGSGGDDLYQVTLNTPLEDANYRIFTAIRYTGNYVSNNDVIVTTSIPTNTGFQLSVRELSMDTQSITIEYIIFKK
ncbi:hypothetical protein [Chryseobacterium sp. AG363]|uniref:hypothetical protein n=1 Tax=Chryseobacterium sp. AG363 TaxID=2183997 RepID=UPI000E7610C7|nr:hypothetical protein [Chryseobacterium sp. AG363]RKE82019.1 hypothetical protein DEU39_1569 [Chryseobacterium sp. AG363]